MKWKKGQFTIEVILASALFMIFSVGIVSVVLQGLDANRTGNETVIANSYASEGLEAVRSMRNQSFGNLVSTTSAGLIRTGANVWGFGGTSNSLTKYMRSIAVSSVNRDGSGNVVASGGTLDPDTKKITSTVTWKVSPQRDNSVVLTTYLTNWKKSILGNWANPIKESNLDFFGNVDAVGIAISGNYAYLIRDAASQNLLVIDISNTISPQLVGTFTIAANPTSIIILNNYAYVSSTNNNSELQIINLSNPINPIVEGNFNAAGSADGRFVFVSGNTAYLSRTNSADPELLTINVTNHASPSLLGSINLNGNLNKLVVLGNYAYIASSDNSRELQVVNVANPASLSLTTTVNLGGNSDALSVNGFGTTLTLGRSGGDFLTINIANPSVPIILNTFNTQGNVNQIAFGNSNNYAFLATSWGSGEFRVLDISNPSLITSLAALNLSNSLTGIVYESTVDRVFVSSMSNTEEFMIIKPQ